jgi:hypothetical protein
LVALAYFAREVKKPLEAVSNADWPPDLSG